MHENEERETAEHVSDADRVVAVHDEENVTNPAPPGFTPTPNTDPPAATEPDTFDPDNGVEADENTADYDVEESNRKETASSQEGV